MRPNSPPMIAPKANAQKTTPRPWSGVEAGRLGGRAGAEEGADPRAEAHLHLHVAFPNPADHQHREEQDEAEHRAHECHPEPAGTGIDGKPEVVAEAQHPAAEDERQRHPVGDLQRPAVDERGQDHSVQTTTSGPPFSPVGMDRRPDLVGDDRGQDPAQRPGAASGPSGVTKCSVDAE